MTTKGVATLLDFGLDRAFPNLYELVFSPPIKNGTGIDLSEKATNMTYYAEKLDFGGDTTVDTEYSEATKQWIIKNAQRIKTASITFRETSQYKVLDFLRDWMGNMYDFQKNIFKDYNPEGIITISIDPVMDGTVTAGSITLSGAYPTLIKYPSYDWADGNPIKINATFSFKDIDFSKPV